jgi:hypothetical protein
MLAGKLRLAKKSDWVKVRLRKSQTKSQTGEKVSRGKKVWQKTWGSGCQLRSSPPMPRTYWVSVFRLRAPKETVRVPIETVRVPISTVSGFNRHFRVPI